MKLYYDRRLSDPTYYAQQGIRNGKKTTTRNVKKFGKHSELLKITDDPLEYVKAEIARMNEEYRVGKVEMELKCDFNERVPKTDSRTSQTVSLNIGYIFLQYILGQLNLDDFFAEITKDRKNTFDCYDILRFLIYARILDPTSKYGTWDQLDHYYEQPQFEYQHILRFMDILSENQEKFLKWLYKQSQNVVPRKTAIMYYDCTNFYFETETEDEDIVDEVTGEIIHGLRKFGAAKDHRPNPIVEMGLIMDQRGIPVSLCIHPGNTNEQLTAIPLEKEVLKMAEGAKFIYCADAGLGSYNIRKFNSLGGRAFIVTQSIKKLSTVMKEAVFEAGDYKLLSDDTPVTLELMKTFDRFDSKNRHLYDGFAYKEFSADNVVDLGLYEIKTLKNGKTKKVKATGVLKQKIIVTFSRKMMEYQRHVRNRQIERARKLIQNNDPEEIKKGPNDVRRFMKRLAKSKNGENAVVSYVLDEDKIAEEEKYDGFYAVATNLSDHPRDVLAVAKQRYKIEDSFRIMKTNFSSRPVYHSKQNRIETHFLTCYVALLVYRLLECRLNDQKTHVTTDELINTLKNMNVVNVHDVEYMALYNGSYTLDALTRLTGMTLDRLHYKPKELNQIIKKNL